MIENDIVLECNKSLNYICSCIYIAAKNNDVNKRDFFAKYLLNNNVNKEQIRDNMLNINTSYLPSEDEVDEIYNTLYDFLSFKDRQIKAKNIFYIEEITKPIAYDFVKKFHYLSDAKFFCEQAFGLYYRRTNKLIGCATFSQPQGISALKGWFGLTNQNKCVYELSRLCMLPMLNGTNATSFLLGGAIRKIKQQKKIKAIITLADSSRHVGSIYQVCNFKYYGLTDSKTDFFTADGRVNPRGATKNIHGVWLPRTRKHRYAYIIDDNLKCLYNEETKPNIYDTNKLSCCNNTRKVYDSRFDEWYTCPRCTGKLEPIEVYK